MAFQDGDLQGTHLGSPLWRYRNGDVAEAMLGDIARVGTQVGTCTGLGGGARGRCTETVGTQWGQGWLVRGVSPVSPPDPGVPTGHLMRPDFGHQDADDAHEHHEVHLGTGTPRVAPPTVGTLPWRRPPPPRCVTHRHGHQDGTADDPPHRCLLVPLPAPGRGRGLSRVPGSPAGDIGVPSRCDKMGKGVSSSLTPRSRRST